MTTTHITANDAQGALTLYGGSITAAATSRTLGGPVAIYGTYGATSRGRLKVAPGALEWPQELHRVKLTREHDRNTSRGHLVSVEDDGHTVRASLRVSDGPDGDAALSEAADHTRDAFSFDVVDATVSGDTITSARVVAIGQVGIPAYDDLRIDQIAAQQTTPSTEGTSTMTEEQRARLAELRNRDQAHLTDAERGELHRLGDLEATEQGDQGQQPAQQPATAGDGGQQPTQQPAQPAQGQQVAASAPVVPHDLRPAARTQPRQGALDAFVDTVVAALQPGGGGAQAITAAFNDVTDTMHGDIVDAPAWSGELWSGVQYAPKFTPLLNSGTLTDFRGEGWRFVTKPEIKDYSGDKATVPTSTVETEPSSYEASRMAVGLDVDRRFYDFPTRGFLQGLLNAVRESWARKLDAKVEGWITTNAVPVTDGSGANVVETSVLRAATVAAHNLGLREVGPPGFIVVNSSDMLTLLDYSANDVPAFLNLWNIEPPRFVSSPDVAAGTVLAGVRQTATVRTLPGSPIRASAQNLANGGIDEAFFGYYAIEEHHTAGIASVDWA